VAALRAGRASASTSTTLNPAGRHSQNELLATASGQQECCPTGRWPGPARKESGTIDVTTARRRLRVRQCHREHLQSPSRRKTSWPAELSAVAATRPKRYTPIFVSPDGG